MTPRILIADPSPFVRMAIRSALAADGIRVVAEVSTSADAIAQAGLQRPDAVLLDWQLDPHMEAAAKISDAIGQGALIVLSPSMSRYAALQAIRAGACGFLPKDTPPARLPAIVRGVLAGEAAFPRRLVRALLVRARPPAVETTSAHDVSELLTTREEQVLALMAQGLRDEGIGDRLGVSPVTVRRHAAAAQRKLRAVGRAQALEYYRGAVA